MTNDLSLEYSPAKTRPPSCRGKLEIVIFYRSNFSQEIDVIERVIILGRRPWTLPRCLFLVTSKILMDVYLFWRSNTLFMIVQTE